MSVSRDEARQLFAAGERDRLSFQLLVQTGRAPLDYPESLPAMLSVSAAEFEQEARMALAVKLFDSRRLTSGQAVTLVKLPRAQFLLECPQWGVASVQWDQEELVSECSDLDQRLRS